jgi:hypothetical protein
MKAERANEKIKVFNSFKMHLSNFKVNIISP